MEPQKDTQKDIVQMYGASDDFYAHARKLVTAVYLLTGLFEDQEPLKWSLRTKVLETMSHTGVLSRSVRPDAIPGDERSVLEDISAIRSLLDIGVLSGLVSPMNHEVLIRELLVFQENAAKHVHSVKGNQVLSTESLFSGFVWKTASGVQQTSKGHYKRTNSVNKGQKRHTEEKENTGTVHGNLKDTHEGVSNERKGEIIRLLKEKGNAMIKDISANFPNFSEKTIQRDLIDLVSQGRIQKSGERRWTVYSFAK